MAQWSATEPERKRAEIMAPILVIRSELFKKFRDGGWKIQVLNPISDDNSPINQLPDKYPLRDPHYLVTMPGTYPMRIKTMEQLLRLVKGVE